MLAESAVECVAGAAHGADPVGAQLSTQVPDVDRHDAGGPQLPLDRRGEPVLRHRLALLVSQRDQQGVFGG